IGLDIGVHFNIEDDDDEDFPICNEILEMVIKQMPAATLEKRAPRILEECRTELSRLQRKQALKGKNEFFVSRLNTIIQWIERACISRR
ncbi:MAG: hypothetical protein KDK78_02780, partial [Chlamydiia bacterium]|nr:hypothetical protein [Chlamydiia bacterium]